MSPYAAGYKRRAMPRASRAKEKNSTAPRGRRLSPELRRSQILDAAAQLVVQQGYLPLPVEQLGRAAGASKALIYTYFATQYDLFNALLEREVASLKLAGLETASRVDDLDQAAILCAMMYFDHVARWGPLLHILLTDRYMHEHLAENLQSELSTFAGRLLKLAKQTLPLSDAEIQAAVEMVAAIPEEAGRLVFHRELDATTARQICNGLITSSLKALRAPNKVAIPE